MLGKNCVGLYQKKKMDRRNFPFKSGPKSMSGSEMRGNRILFVTADDWRLLIIEESNIFQKWTTKILILTTIKLGPYAKTATGLYCIKRKNARQIFIEYPVIFFFLNRGKKIEILKKVEINVVFNDHDDYVSLLNAWLPKRVVRRENKEIIT